MLRLLGGEGRGPLGAWGGPILFQHYMGGGRRVAAKVPGQEIMMNKNK